MYCRYVRAYVWHVLLLLLLFFLLPLVVFVPSFFSRRAQSHCSINDWLFCEQKHSKSNRNLSSLPDITDDRSISWSGMGDIASSSQPLWYISFLTSSRFISTKHHVEYELLARVTFDDFIFNSLRRWLMIDRLIYCFWATSSDRREADDKCAAICWAFVFIEWKEISIRTSLSVYSKRTSLVGVAC